MNVLLAMDASANSTACLSLLESRMGSANLNVRVISVTDSSLLTPHRLSEGEAAQIVKQGVDQLKNNNPDRVNGEVLHGHPPDKIIEAANIWPADMVFMGAHTRRGLSEILGSVAAAVSKNVNCSVVLARAAAAGESESFDKCMVCLQDDSDLTEKVLSSVSNYRWGKSDKLLLVSVLEPPSTSGSENPHSDAILSAQTMRDGRVEVEKFLESKLSQLRQSIPLADIEYRIAEDLDVAGVLCKIAVHWGARLIVMGSHGRKGMDKLWFGSVSEAMAKTSACSVQIVR